MCALQSFQESISIQPLYIQQEIKMCGIVGILGTPNAAKESYLGLLMLQHRGQDSAGILSFHSTSGSFHSEKNLGHIKDAISEIQIENLIGDSAIAHTRYSTIGKVRREEIQPMLMNYPYGIGMAHNGNLINADEIKKELLTNNRRLVLSKNDLEIMMNLLAEGLSKNKDKLNFDIMVKGVEKIFTTVKGAYSAVTLIADHGLLAFKDPNGIRPLSWGKRKLNKEEKLSPHFNPESKLEYSFAVASESKSLEFLGYSDIQEMSAGEILFISNQGEVFQTKPESENHSPCMFEWIYFANADSRIWSKSVYQMRLRFGELLGQYLVDKNLDIDVVVPVPDTSRPSAITISEALKKPYREVLIKNRYAQRTFMLNSQSEREKAVHLKMNVVKEEIQNKNILLVDDSIVRGTTSKKIIKMLKQNGAKKVILVSSCPAIIRPCYFGIDFPLEKDLIAAKKTNTEIAEHIGADAVYFLSIEDLKKSFGNLNTCMACLNGKYPIDVSSSHKMIETRIKDEKPDIPGIS